MADSCMNELEDTVWNDYDQINDHVVPRPHERHAFRHVFHGDSLKTHQSQGTGVTNNAADCHTAMYVNKAKGERRGQPYINSGDIMQEEYLWSNEEATNLASDNTKMSSQCFENRNTESVGTDFSTDDLVISEGCGAVESDSYDYPLGDIIQADNDLSFCEDKESNDLFHYGWSNIGNFEDVDKMFSSCDSTFGLGSVGNEELNWFSSPHTIDGSEDVLKSSFQFSCPDSSPFDMIREEDCGPEMNNTGSSLSYTNVDNASLCYRPSLEPLKDGDPEIVSHFTFLKESDSTCDRNDKFTPVQKGVERGNVPGGISTADHNKNEMYGMISFQKKQERFRNKSEGKRKDRDLEKNSSQSHRSNLRSDGTEISFRHSSLTSPDIQKQKKSMTPTNTLAFSHTPVPYTNLDYIRRPDQIPVLSTSSVVNSDSSGLTTLSPKDSSNASTTRLRSTGSSQRWPVDVSSIPVNGRNVSLQSREGYYPSYTGNHVQVGLVVQPATCDPISDPMQVKHSQIGIENHNEIDGVRVRTPEDVDTSPAQESSCMSGLDDISLEASSFRQLQKVMEQLDIRTKLCIRDSLYRLARSAEQRHPYDLLDSSGGSDKDPNGASAEGRQRCGGFLNIETDTNPIDRSIAHLLFHRPTDSSAAPVLDGLPIESNSMVQGSMLAEKLVRNEQTDSEADHRRSLQITDDDR